MDKRSDYRAFCQHWNRAIKAIGTREFVPRTAKRGLKYVIAKHNGVVPYITAYYARACWASFCYNLLDIPMDTISQALGHNSGKMVTNFYVKRGEEKVDKANRALIDRLNQSLYEFNKKRELCQQ